MEIPTRENAAVLFLDLQDEIVKNSRTVTLERLSRTAGALSASKRRVLILAGVASEIVVQRTALDALAAGYVVHIAVDACGGVDGRTEDAAWRRICAAGGVTTSAITFAAELTGDFTTELGSATLGIVYETLGG